jgi:hypothetical protein
MSARIFHRCSLSVLLIVASFAGALAQTGAQRRRRPTAQSKRTAIFNYVEYGGVPTLMPVLLMQGAGRYVAPPAFHSKAARRRFAETYYRPGQKYSLFSRGSEVGTATVKKLNACDAMAAEVEVNSPERITNSDEGVLTMSPGAPLLKAAERRDATDAEGAALLKLVQPYYRRRGIDVPEIGGVASWVRATDLDGDGLAELVGFFATGAKSQHTLFIIAEPRGKSFKAALVLFHPSMDKWGDDGRHQQFVDAVDLDGDGVFELLTSGNDPRSTNDFTYIVYKKQGGRWRSVYVGGGLKCASEAGGEVY